MKLEKSYETRVSSIRKEKCDLVYSLESSIHGRNFIRWNANLEFLPSLVALSVGAVSFLWLLATPAVAQCVVNGSPAISGTGGDDTVLCDATNTPTTTLNTLGGNDQITINGATISSDVDLGLGDDTLIFLSGMANNIIRMNGGDNTVIIYDDANFPGGINPGTGNATLIFRTDVAQTLDGNYLINFDQLTKEGAGVLTNTGIFPLLFTNGVLLNGGVIDVGFYVGGSTLAMADDTTLIVDGGFGSNVPGATTVLTGSSGVNSITVTDANTFPFQNGFYAAGDLGDGADLLTTAGIVNTGAGILLLGLGDDVFTINGGADVTGIVGGGDGDDQVNADIALAATGTVDRMTDFETLTKTGAGTLVVDGAGASNISTVNVNAGVLNVAVGGSIIDVGAATVASGVTVNLAGSFSFTTGIDTFDVSGTLTGAGAFDLLDGDDTLTLRDGADLSGLTSAIDGGVGTDVVNADISTSATFGAAAGFESLIKFGSGALEVVGPAGSSFDTVNVNAGTLDIDAVSAITNVNMATVLGGATLNADGALSFTAGADTLTVIGTVSGTSTMDLGAGDDTFTFQESAITSAPVNGGTGTDTLNAHILTTGSLAQATNFETLTKTGAGVLNITGGAVSDFSTVNVNDGTLDIAAGNSLSNVNAATVAASATLDSDGTFDFTAGGDTFDISGVVTGAGTFDMLGDDDTLILRDGADLSGLAASIDGNTGADTVVVDNASSLNFNGSQVANFETLQKDNTGMLTLAGTQSYAVATTLNGGTLDVDGTLETPTVTLADATTLNIDGILQTAGPTQTGITGSAGVNTVNVNASATLLATGDLGDGADVLNVSGTLNTGSGTLALGLGDDTFTIADGSNVIGLVDGGAGTDTFNTNISTTASAGTVTGFETLTKTGTGQLNLIGPATSSFDTVNVNAGALDVAVSSAVNNVNAVTVASGATLTVDGALDFTTGADTLAISGVVSGSGTVDLREGDDRLTLRDGANLTGLANAIDGNTGTDTLVVDTATALALDGSNIANFERLQKGNTGTLTVAGSETFSGGTSINGGTLDVDDTLTTATVTMADGATLNVDGTLNNGIGQAAITGSAGVNTITVTGTVLADGDLGDGADVLDVSGTLDTAGGRLALGLGDDTFTITDGTQVVGTVDGGAGTDTFNTNISTTADIGAVQGFETLTKTGTGLLNLTGPATSSFDTINVNAGTVDADGSISNVGSATVLAGATLNVDGPLSFTTGADSLTVAGTVSGASAIDLLDGDDTFTFQEGASVSVAVDGGAGTDTLNANIATTGTLAQATNFEILDKTGAGELDITGPGTSNFSIVNVNDGTLDVEAGSAASNVNSATVAAGATLNADGDIDFTNGSDTLDVSGVVSGSGTVDLLLDDDTLTLRDGTDLSGLTGVIDGNIGVDTVVVNTTGTVTFDGSNIDNFENLQKDNTGTLVMTGAETFSGGTVLNDGTLDVDGTLGSAAVTMADGTTLNVDGTLNDGAAGQATITGSTGVNTVTVAGTLLADGDLGDGNDVLDVSGTLDTGGGTLALGLGDDTFTITDGTNVVGTVDGGTGTDTFNTNISTAADIGAVQGFETLDKTGTGTLNVTGTDTSDFNTVNVTAGTLNVAAAGAIDGVNNATVANAATLTVQGTFDFTTGDDSLDVSGAVNSNGTLDLLDGDDTLTLRDGSDLSGLTSAIDGSIGTDIVVVDTTATMTLDSSNIDNFENLQKDNTGTLSITGSETFSSGTTINDGELVVDGTLGTATVVLADDTTLTVDGTLNDGAAGQASFAGSAGTNIVTVTGTLLADGDLGDGNDVLDVSGTLDTGGGTFMLGAGDDTFVVHDTTVVIGALDAGLGNDTLNVNVSAPSLVPLGSTIGFEWLAKSGLGGLQINGPSSFIDVDVQEGRLEVSNSGSVAAQNTQIASNSTLQIVGAYTGTGGDDTVDIAGMVTGTGTFDLMDGDDTLILRDGADLSGLANAIDGNTGTDTVVVNNTATVTFDGSNIDNFESLQKDNTGILTITGSETFSGGTTLNGGTLDVDGALGVPTVTMADDTILTVDGTLNDGAAGQASVTGSVGANTVTVAGTLLADGDLGDGNDVLDISGTLSSGAGTLTLGDGDDTFTIHDGTNVTGTVDGGTGTDTFNTNINTSADIGAVQSFETLTKTGTGTLNINGPAASDFNTVNVNAGTVDITATGAVNGVNNATVAAGASLNIDGVMGFTPGADTFNVAGAVVSAANPIDLLDGNDVVTVDATGDVTGDTLLGLGNDVFNLTGGVNTGDIYGDGMAASAADGDDTFNWSGGELNSGFFGGNGSDTATISGAAVYDGTEDFDGGDDVSAVDGWIDTLTFDGITATAAAGTVRNWENVLIDGGSIGFADGTLTVGSETGLGLTLSNGGTLNTSGGFVLTGNLINTSGVINSQDGNAGDRIRVSGDYTGGGQFRTDVDFTTDTADVLEVTGDVVGGSTLIVVNDVSSGQASGNDVLVVEVGGAAAADAFSSASVISGAWTYDLSQVGQNFYLNGTSAGLSPLATAYEVYPQTLKALNQLPTLQQRVGQRRWAVIEKNIVDADLDGVVDELDRCPNTAAKVVVDQQGCQKMLTETVSVELEVNFANDSSRLLEGASQEIAKLARFMREHPDTSVVIEGHSSAAGSERYNQWLSERRANAIAIQLSEIHGISAERVAAIGYGESHPKVTGTDLESAQQNRRVVAAISTIQSVAATGERADNPEWISLQTAQQVRRHGLWMRIEGERRDQKAASSTASAEYDLSRTLLQVGYDVPLVNNQKGAWVGGITAHYTEADTDASSPAGDASVDSRGYGAGLTATWYGNNQAYTDLQVQVSRYETDLSSDLDPELADDLDGEGWIMSIETGKRFSREDWSFTPQVQMTYGVIGFDRFGDNFGSNVSLQEDESLIGRLGIALSRDRNWEKNGSARRSHLYSILNLNYQFKDKTEVDVSGTSLVFEEDNWTADIGVGGTYEWADGRWVLFGEASVQTGLEHLGKSNSIGGTIGIRGNL